MAEAAEALSGEVAAVDPRHAEVLHTLAATLAEQARVQRQDRLVVAGAANLVRTEEDFAGSILAVIEAIEEQVVLLRLFGEMAADEHHSVAVRIGRENAPYGLGETSVVSSSFAIPGRDVSRLGIVGPTRMDYSQSMAAVRAVARYLSRTLGES
jgi:heat-inducible transcriptional repressor